MTEEKLIEPEGQEQGTQEPSIFARILRALVALSVLVGLVYISGLNQYLFYQKTPSTLEQKPVASAVDAKELVVPVSLFLLRNDGGLGSERTPEQARNLVEQASQIWKQANITLEVRALKEIEKTDEAIALLLDEPRMFVEGVEGFDASAVNVFLPEILRARENAIRFAR